MGPDKITNRGEADPARATAWDPDGVGLARPEPHDTTKRFDTPTLSGAIEPNLLPKRVPSDPRMRGWRVYEGKKAIDPERYRGVNTTATGDVLVWEHPVSGELRRCEAVYLDVWDDPWHEDNERILAEIRGRICTCDRTLPDGDWGELGPCTCGRDKGSWTYSDGFWTENIKPVPKRQRKLPAQYPMHTRWGRFRSWWWHTTHRQTEPVPVPAADDYDDIEEWVG